MPGPETLPGPKSIFFFDIDNCVRASPNRDFVQNHHKAYRLPEILQLYSKSKQIHKLMKERIGASHVNVIPQFVAHASTDEYFINNLSLPPADALKLHNAYYTQYGLALEGLVRNHKIDPLEYNALVDDALALEDIIHPDPRLRQLLQDFDRDKVRLWLFTNAYINHGKRVVKLLGVDDLFDGITYCDYGAFPLICKPQDVMYAKAQDEASAASPGDCYFVDDSYMNCKRAQELGWTTTHILEPEDPEPAIRACKYQIRSLEELRVIFPQFFKSSESY